MIRIPKKMTIGEIVTTNIDNKFAKFDLKIKRKNNVTYAIYGENLELKLNLSRSRRIGTSHLFEAINFSDGDYYVKEAIYHLISYYTVTTRVGKARVDKFVERLNQGIDILGRFEGFKCSVCETNSLTGEELDGGVCSHCIETNQLIPCSRCGEFHRANTGIDYEGRRYCPSCVDNYLYRCDDCGTYSRNSTCTICRPRHGVLSYSSKPEPIFKALEGEENPYFYGIEIEMELTEDVADRRNSTVAELYHPMTYYKPDGSLRRGVELVTHPCSMKYHEQELLGILKSWRELGSKSHDTDTCGIHVHVGKAQLGETDSEIEEVTNKIIWFVDAHWSEIHKFTRREMSRLSNWAGNRHSSYGRNLSFQTLLELFNNTGSKEAKLSQIIKRATGSSNTRYLAINTRNAHTVEFRMFRGSLRDGTVMAILQFIELLIEFCKQKTMVEIMETSLFQICTGKYKELDEYLERIEMTE